MNNQVIRQTDLPNVKLFKRGKVRDIYDLEDALLIVATDRISAFDVVLPDPIPYKGQVLTQLSAFWFHQTRHIINNHLISVGIDSLAHERLPEQIQAEAEWLAKRTMLVRKAEPIPVECVVRGYLAGSAWREYQQSQTICGIKLPAGYVEADKLKEPIFTPATKAQTGHDENITISEMEELVGTDIAHLVIETSLAIYEAARSWAEPRGIIIADTKFEFGVIDGKIILIDELLTPDSSRFWPKERYQPGKAQVSFDKQFVRDYLEGTGWDKTPPAPNLPESIIQKTSEAYQKAYRILTEPLH